MKFKYIMTRDIVERLMKETYFRMNAFYLCVYTILYMVISSNLIRYNFTLAFSLYMIGLILLLLFLVLFSVLFMRMNMAKNDKQSSKIYGNYDCIIDDKGIMEILNGEESFTSWDQVTKVIHARYFILVVSKNRGINIKYRRANFEDPKIYDDVVKTIDQHYKKIKDKKKKK